MIQASAKILRRDAPLHRDVEHRSNGHARSSQEVGDATRTGKTRDQSPTTRLARQILRMLQVRGMHGDDGVSGEHAPSARQAVAEASAVVPRVLILEPRSDALCRVLRGGGFAGELWALLRRSITDIPTATQLRSGYDRIACWDWSESITRLNHTTDSGATLSKAPANLGVFSAVVVSDASRLVPADQLSLLLASLGSLVQERGYLFVSEPYPDVDTSQMEQQLLHSGMVLASDPENIGDDWPRTLATFQKRGDEEAHLIGALQRVDWPAVESNVSRQEHIVATYREVFGGDEWHEWVRCTRPGANHHYSQREAALLSPPDRCLCGWSRPLQPFHTYDTVLEKLHHEIACQSTSCCYMRINSEDAVEGFTWGYLAEVDDVAHMLAGDHGGRACDELRRHIGALVSDVDGNPLHTAESSPRRTRIFYHSELGVRNSARSLSLARGLFHRAFQFGYDQGASVVVLRTSINSPAYDISMGLEMRTLYRYAEATGTSVGSQHDHDGPQQPSTTQHNRHRKAQRELSSILEQQPDTRVVVGGDLKRMLRHLGGESDRRLVMRMLHAKRGRS